MVVLVTLRASNAYASDWRGLGTLLLTVCVAVPYLVVSIGFLIMLAYLNGAPGTGARSGHFARFCQVWAVLAAPLIVTVWLWTEGDSGAQTIALILTPFLVGIWVALRRAAKGLAVRRPVNPEAAP